MARLIMKTSKIISARERRRRDALRMRNQQPDTIARNRMNMQMHWMKKKGLLLEAESLLPRPASSSQKGQRPDGNGAQDRFRSETRTSRINKTYNHRPRFARDQIKHFTPYRRVEHTLSDGYQILSAHAQDAEVELAGFCIMNGLKWDKASAGNGGDQALPTKVLLTACTNTSDEAREAAVKRYLAKHYKFRMEGEEFSLVQRREVREGKTTFRRIAREHNRSVLLGCLSYLRGRADGWLLLGTSDEKTLEKLVCVSFGPQSLKEMRKVKALPYSMVKQLLARKNQIEFDRIKAEMLQKKVVGAGRRVRAQGALARSAGGI